MTSSPSDFPYESTRKDGYGKGFDKQEFVEWAQEQDVSVYVSEYTMHEGYTRH